jgi:hypothetical protein
MAVKSGFCWSHRNFLRTPLALALFWAGSACVTPDENSDGGGEARAEDAGFFSGTDGGSLVDGGSNTAPDGSGGPLGPGDGGSSGPPDAGFDFGDGGLPDFGDASTFLYNGSQEEGVLCGDNLDACDVDDACCVIITLGGTSGSCLASGGSCAGGATDLVAKADCDGPEDCTGSTVCCITGAFPALASECVADPTECTDTRAGTLVCVAQEDCPPTEVCCGTDFGLPVDMGICSLPAEWTGKAPPQVRFT